MRNLLALMLAVSTASCSHPKTCRDTVRNAPSLAGNTDSPEATMLIGVCEQADWSTDVHACVHGAADVAALAACVEPTLPGERKPPPIVIPPPSDATKAELAKATVPIRALMFFYEPDDVWRQVEAYLTAAGKLAIEHRDAVKDPRLAEQYKMMNGGIVLVRGTGADERFERIDLHADRLSREHIWRDLEHGLRYAIVKLLREPHVAYLSVGHGELNDQDSVPAEQKGRLPERRSTVLKKRLAELNYEVKPLDLAKPIPTRATIVLVLAPTVPFSADEWATLGRYLDQGGRILIALDPKADPSLGSLEGKLGVKLAPGDLTDDKTFLPQRKNDADHRFVLTTQFSAHASTTALSRAVAKGLVLIDAGALVDAPFSDAVSPKRIYTIHSMETSWLDHDDNFKFDPAGATPEVRQRWNIAAAIEAPQPAGFRALVYADVDLFADVLVQNAGHTTVIMISGPLIDDAVRWLGGEEAFSGEVVVDEPVPPKQPTEPATDPRAMRVLGELLTAKPAERAEALGHLRTMQDRR